MAFPTVADADTKNGTVVANSTSWTGTFPTNIVAGDLLLLFVAADGGGVASAVGSGFARVGISQASSAATLTLLGKVASGTETGTFTITISATEQGGWRIFRIPAASWFGGTLNADVGGASDSNGLSVGGGGANGADSNPNPGSLNPANWATEDTLWFAAAAVDTSRTFSAFPTNYTNTASDVSGGAGGASLGTCRFTNAAASEDPGTFTISGADDWACLTVAVRPAAAVATKSPPPFQRKTTRWPVRSMR